MKTVLHERKKTVRVMKVVMGRYIPPVIYFNLYVSDKSFTIEGF